MSAPPASLEPVRDAVPRVGSVVLLFHVVPEAIEYLKPKRNANVRVLLVQRGREPLAGYWTLPGGKVELGETLKATAVRELFEETGVRLVEDALRPLGWYEVIGALQHRIVCAHEALLISREAKATASDDAADAAWMTRDEVEKLVRARRLTPTAERALRDAGWLPGGAPRA